LVLSDATQFRTGSNFFHVAFSAQFYEHIPGSEKRLAFLKNVWDTLKQDGIFISTMYHQDLRRVIKKLPQEGKHPTGIYYHYFLPREIKRELNTCFKILTLHPIDITLPLEARIKILRPIDGLISRTFEHIHVINKLGHLLIVKARKTA